MNRRIVSKIVRFGFISTRKKSTVVNTGQIASALNLVHHTFQDVDLEADKTSIIVMHGMMGSSNNWRSIAKGLCKTGRKVITVDARNHGESPHCEDMNYFLMTDDVLHLMDNLGEEKVTLIGHSMGGKAFMTMALTHPDRVESLVVVDVSPRQNIRSVNMPVYAYLQSMLKITSSLSDADYTSLAKAKQHGDRILQEAESDLGIRQFLLTNLVYRNNRFRWKVNLDAIINNIPVLATFPDLNQQYHGSTLFVGGENSDYILSSDLLKINQLFPQAIVKYIENAGHWVHSEKPKEFLDTVTDFLEANDKQRLKT